MKVVITKTDRVIVLEITNIRGRFVVSNYKPEHIDYAREQSLELARILGCKVEEVEQ